MKKKICVFFLAFLLLVLPVSALCEEYSVYEYYYTQLSSEEKVIYSAFQTAVTAETQEFEITTLPQSLTRFVLYKKGLSSGAEIREIVSESSELLAITQKINAFFQTAMDAFLLDHPEYFWVDGGNCSIAMSYSTKPYSASEGKIDVSVVFIGNWTVKSGYDGYEEEYQQVVQKIKAIDAGESRFYILKKIHDFLCDTIVYDKTALRHGDAAGALLDGKAVCQGYAHAFKIACDFYNIPCICVTGTGLGNNGPEAHMWNYVQMEDGFWYAVDCTWDDGIQKIYYDYFLSGISTVDTYFGKNTFEDTHIADGRQTSNSEKTFIYPALAANAYVEQGERLPATQIPEITPENNITAVPTENITALPTLRETEGALNLEEETNLNTGELDTEEAVVQKTDECSDSFHSKESIEKKKSLNLWVVVISVGTAMVGLGLVGILFVKRRQHSSDHTAGEGKINDNR